MTPSECALFIWAILLAAAAIATPSAAADSDRAAGASPAGAQAEITISAAVSLKDALDEISAAYRQGKSGVTVRLNLGGSGTLHRQIEQGAPVDLFISASPEEMDALEYKGLLLAGTRRDIVKNRMVLIVPMGKSTITSFQDLDRPEAKRIAIGEPQTVPAGKYAQQVLSHLGMYDRLKPKLIFGKDARQALTYVATGNVDAGIVYATDAKTSPTVRVVTKVPDGWHSPVVYPVGIIKTSKNPAAAKDFENFLLGPSARLVFQKYDFVPTNP